MTSSRKLRDFVRNLTEIANANPTEQQVLAAAHPLMNDLLRTDEWLPDAFAVPGEDYYRQYLLHCDPLERFSLVSFVWGPGQVTPIHNHETWGLLGVLRGSEVSERFEWAEGELHANGPREVLDTGAIDMVSPTIGDIHRVRNGSDSRASVSIHLYGGNIGAIDRHAFNGDGSRKVFRSGYSLETLPNIWSAD